MIGRLPSSSAISAALLAAACGRVGFEHLPAGNVQGDVGPGDTLTGPGDTFNSALPVVTVTAPGPGQLCEGGTEIEIRWVITDIDLAQDSVNIHFSEDGGFNWVEILLSQEDTGTTTWAVPLLNSNTVQVRVQATDLLGNIGTGTSANFTVDSTPPQFRPAQMQINGGATTTARAVVGVSLLAEDQLCNISHFCLKTEAIAPADDDSCWRNVTDAQMLPSLSLQLSDHPITLGFTPSAYVVYAWARDELGHTSTLSGGVGTEGQDRVSILYDPGAPPVLANIWATNVYPASSPPQRSEQLFAFGQTVFIRWHASAYHGFSTAPIRLSYTTDSLTYVDIAGAEGLQNGSNGGCSFDSALHTGCFTWSDSAPTDAFFRIRVIAEDQLGFNAGAQSGLLNSRLRMIAGNIDRGLDTSATAATLRPKIDWVWGMPDHNSLVVTPDGRVFYRDDRLGLIMIEPQEQIFRQLIPTTGSSTGDGGPASMATLTRPNVIAYGHQHGLLIWDDARIRRIDLTTMQIDTLTGAGSSSADDVPLAEVHIDLNDRHYDDSSSPWNTAVPVIALPNGDIWFRSETDSQSTLTSPMPLRVRVYHHATGMVTSVYPSGTGYSADPDADLSNCNIRGLGLVYDVKTSAVSRLMMAVEYNVGGCSDGGIVAFDPTGATLSEQPPSIPNTSPGYLRFVTGHNGELYIHDNARIYHYDPMGNQWQQVAGNPDNNAEHPGVCEPGNAASACYVHPKGAFVDKDGLIFFVDRARIRVIDRHQIIRDLYAQPLHYGDGGLPQNARFNEINYFGVTDAGEIIVYDENEYRFRIFDRALTAIQTYAGNGNNEETISVPRAALAAIGDKINCGWGFALDPATGDVYINFGRSSISRLNRAAGRWEAFVGGGSTNYPMADGLPGDEIRLGATYYTPLGFSETHLAMGVETYIVGDSFIKLYDKTDSVQSHLIGSLGSATVWDADSANTATTKIRATAARASYTWDPYDNRWLVLETSGGRRIRTIDSTSLGTLLVAPRDVGNFAYRRDAGLTVHDLFYCGSADEALYRYDLITGEETPFPWPVDAINCSGRTLYYDAVNSWLYLIVEQDGLKGMAVYELP